MALTTNTQANAESIVNVATGFVVTDAGAAADTNFQLGFKPRYVKWINLTDRIIDEWWDGMAVDGTGVLHTVAAGTITLPGTGGLIIGANIGKSSENPGQFTVPAALIPASKSFAWYALG